MSDPIDSLLDQATAYALQRLSIANDDANSNNCDDDDDDADDAAAVLDFSIDSTHLTTLDSIARGNLMEIKKDEVKGGRGMYAKRDIVAGERLVVAKPLALVMDWEVGEDEEEDDDDIDLGGDSGDDDDSYGNGNDNNAKKRLKPDYSALKTPEDDNNEDDVNISDEENSSPEENAAGTKRNGILILRLLQSIQQDPSLWTNTLSHLFPRDEETALQLPMWMCGDVSVGMEIEREFETLESLCLFGGGDADRKKSSSIQQHNNGNKEENEKICNEIKLRLPLLVRYNVLSVETSSELFVYPDIEHGGLMELAGTGLYGPEVSYLNHSNVPNVSRYAIGDVMFFVANRDVAKGEELCFSYIEHELLCENATKRTALLDMDFEEQDGDDSGDNYGTKHKKQKIAMSKSNGKKEDGDNNDKEEEVSFPLVDADFQSEVMSAPPSERLELIQELLNPETTPLGSQDYQCDKHQLHILHAITLDGLGRTSEALDEWEVCIDFAVKHFPPLDENTIVLRVQAALCAKMANKMQIASRHAHGALEMHNLLFGGGTERFWKRYEKELKVQMRPRPEAQLAAHAKALFAVST